MADATNPETARIVVALFGADGQTLDAQAIVFSAEVECVDALQWQMVHANYAIYACVTRALKAVMLARALTAPGRWAARGMSRAAKKAMVTGAR